MIIRILTIVKLYTYPNLLKSNNLNLKGYNQSRYFSKHFPLNLISRSIYLIYIYNYKACNFHGYWKNIMWKFQGSTEKEVVFSGLTKKISYWISISLHFLHWNFQAGLHNFMEFARVKFCFVHNFQE